MTKNNGCGCLMSGLLALAIATGFLKADDGVDRVWEALTDQRISSQRIVRGVSRELAREISQAAEILDERYRE